MPLETATYIPDLVTSNPAHTDGLSQADSHMRLLKATIKATLPNFTSGPLQSTQAQLDNAVAVSAGTAVHTIPIGTAALPGLAVIGNLNTGLWSPAANQLAFSLAGAQVLLMGGSAIVTSLSLASTSAIGAAAIASTGAYSGGTGQLVPIGAVLEWYDDVLPTEGGYCWANGQIIASANTVCPILLARWGTRFGGNGITTMGVPDRRDTVGIGKSTMGGVASRGLQTLTNTVLGTLIGLANNVLTTLNLPPYTPVGSVASSISTTGTNISSAGGGGGQAFTTAASAGGTANMASPLGASVVSGFTGTAQGGLSQAINNVQPSTTCNYILRLA